MAYLQFQECMTKMQCPLALMILAWLALPRIKTAWTITQDLFIKQTCGDKHSPEAKVNQSWKKKQLTSKGKPSTKKGQQATFKIPRVKAKCNASAFPKTYADSCSHQNRQGYVPFAEYAQWQFSS